MDFLLSDPDMLKNLPAWLVGLLAVERFFKYTLPIIKQKMGKEPLSYSQERLKQSLLGDLGGAQKRPAEKVLEALMNSSEGVALVSPQGVPIIANHALCNMLGYSAEELSRMPFHIFTHPDDVEEDMLRFDEVKRGLIKSYTLKKRFIPKGGGWFWAHLTVTTAPNGGVYPYCLGFVRPFEFDSAQNLQQPQPGSSVSPSLPTQVEHAGTTSGLHRGPQ